MTGDSADEVEVLEGGFHEVSEIVGVGPTCGHESDHKKKGWFGWAKHGHDDHDQNSDKKSESSGRGVETPAPSSDGIDLTSLDDSEREDEAATRDEMCSLVKENRALLTEATEIRASRKHSKTQSHRLRELDNRLSDIADRLVFLELGEHPAAPPKQTPSSAPPDISFQSNMTSSSTGSRSTVSKTHSERSGAHTQQRTPQALSPTPGIVSMTEFDDLEDSGDDKAPVYSSEAVQAVLNRTKEKLALREEKLSHLDSQTQVMSEEASTYLSATKELKAHMGKKKKGWFH